MSSIEESIVGSERGRETSEPIRVSIIVPCRNEELFVKRAIGSLLAQKSEGIRLQVLVADGSSEDGTLGILREMAAKDARLRVLNNPRRSTPAALEVLLAEADGEILVRADAHSEYPVDYVVTLVRYLLEGGADNVGGVWETRPGDSSLQARAIAAALTSRFGVGVSYRTRRGEEPCHVETVPFGAWRSEHFKRFGPFDPRFIRAQDLEHNIRVRRMGGTILCLPWLRIGYFARRSLIHLARMAFDYGYWKVPVQAKHAVRFSPRQFFPPLLVLGVSTCLVLSIWLPLALLPVGCYGLMVILGAAGCAWDKRSARIAGPCALALILMHFGYGIGYIVGWLDIYVFRRRDFRGDPPLKAAGGGIC